MIDIEMATTRMEAQEKLDTAYSTRRISRETWSIAFDQLSKMETGRDCSHIVKEAFLVDEKAKTT